MRRRTGRLAAGFTLVELMIASTLAALVLGSIAMVGLTGTRVYGTETLRAELDANARRLLEQVAVDLRMAGAGKVTPATTGTNGSTSLLFQQAVDVNAGAVVWTLPLSVELDYAPGETDDGADENGNGLVDEGQVVWTRDAGSGNEQRIVLCSWVREYLEGETPNGVDDNGNGLIDERGLCFERVDDAVVIRVTLERVDQRGQSVVRTLSTTVHLRN